MCASYGLDPRFTDPDEILAGDEDLFEELRSWAERNAGATLLPTGKNLRNLNPILRQSNEQRQLEPAWWGYLVNGAPSKFPSINTRAERLIERKGAAPRRAIVPATAWFEMQKPDRQWFRFGSDAHQLFGLAAVTQTGRTSDGSEFTCYSIVMGPSTEALAPIHDRAPLLIPTDFADEWLTSDEPLHEVVGTALARSQEAQERITAAPIARRP